jgi:hypothetical protein
MANSNKPAFPISEETTNRIDYGVSIYTGLTKREYFAALAMQGLCAEQTPRSLLNVAETSVKIADLLLKELEKSNQ